MGRRATILLTLGLLAAAAVHAQGDWATLNHNGEYAFARGFMDRAESDFKKALEIAQGFAPGDRRLETSLENLGRFYEHQSEFDKAQPLYQLLLAARENRLGTDDPGLLGPLFAVARVSQPAGDIPTVISSLEKFDAIARASTSADPRQWWQAQAMLARMYVIQDDEAAGLEWQRRAVEVLETDSNATDEERAIQLESLAQMELKAGEGRTAEQLYVRVAELRIEENEAHAMPRTMMAGAEAAYGAGEFITAERLAMRGLNAHPGRAAELTGRTVLADVSWARVNRGTDDLEILLAAADTDEELVVARDRLRALVIFEDGSNPESLSRLVQVEALRGQPLEAARWQNDLILITDGPAIKQRLDLVTLLAAAGKTDEALDENASVLAALETEYGSSDSRLEPVLGQRLNILIDAGRKKEARKVKKRLKKLSR